MGILDMGTGPAAVLPTNAKLRLDRVSVIRADHCEELVELARKQADALNLKMDLVVSDLYAGLEGLYDLIVFNAPYIDIGVGKDLKVPNDSLSPRRWSDGVGGFDSIDRFLMESPAG